MNFDLGETYILENDRVLLRPLKVSDKELLMNFAINEPEIWRFNIHGGNGKENFERYFDAAIKQYEAKNQYPFIVFDKRHQKHAGMTRFSEIFNEFKRLDIGFTWYGKEFQGTGLNKNCKYLLLEFAFEKLQMNRVGLGANSKNERSINAMKSIGCQVEGILRAYSKDADGNIIDIIRLSVLKKEWEERVKMDLKKQTEKYACS